ncbi:MAG: SpoIIIAH-like family protein [Ruminococcus sp.]
MKKKLFRKNQVIITALAVMIAVAGYINYSDSRLKTQSDGSKEQAEETADMGEITEDIESLDYDLTDEIAEAAEAENAQTQTGETDSQTDETALEEESDQTQAEDSTSEEGTDTETADASTETPGEAVLTGASTYVAQARISREQIRSQNKETLLEIINNEELSQEEKQSAVDSMVSMTDMIEKEAAAESLLEAKGFESVVVNLDGDTADVMVPTGDLDASQLAQIEDAVKRKTGVEASNIVITPMDESVAE